MSDDADARIAALENENAELKRRVEALEPKPKVEFKPGEWKGPRDWTEGMSMDRATMAAFAAAVPDHLVRSVVSDNMRSAPVAKPAEGPVVPSERGWRDQVPLEHPPGVKIIDQMMDAEDVVWRRELAKKLSGK
jgi:hypothetical protein